MAAFGESRHSILAARKTYSNASAIRSKAAIELNLLLTAATDPKRSSEIYVPIQPEMCGEFDI